MAVFNQWIETDGCGTMPTSLINAMELLPISALNSFPNLQNVPVGGLLMLVINGETFTPEDGSFTVTGQVINWTSTHFNVDPSSVVVAIYSYEG